MPRRVSMVVLSVGVALALAACGGTKKYSLPPTKACLAKQSGLRLAAITRKEDFVAYSASAAIRVFLPKNEVTISFGEDQSEADRLVRGYRRFHGKNIGIEDVLRPQKNAVLLWQAHPSDQDLATIDHCLK